MINTLILYHFNFGYQKERIQDDKEELNKPNFEDRNNNEYERNHNKSITELDQNESDENQNLRKKMISVDNEFLNYYQNWLK